MGGISTELDVLQVRVEVGILITVLKTQINDVLPICLDHIELLAARSAFDSSSRSWFMLSRPRLSGSGLDDSVSLQLQPWPCTDPIS